nr:MAG TPA: hypothetical protein [Caudoviricetes sp.]
MINYYPQRLYLKSMYTLYSLYILIRKVRTRNSECDKLLSSKIVFEINVYPLLTTYTPCKCFNTL